VGRNAKTNESGEISPRDGKEYEHKVKSSLYWPSNVVSGNVSTGYQANVVSKFKKGTIITNLHSDTFSPTNDIGMQGPFTEAHVGGHQSRHVDLNKFKGPSGLVTKTNATAVITIADRPNDGDTITFGDGLSDTTVFTFKTVPANDDHIQRGASASQTRDFTKVKLEARFNVSIVKSGNDLQITNNNAGAAGNVSLSETFTSSNNSVSGFTGGEEIYRTLNNLDDQYSRPEGWRLLLRECSDTKPSFRISGSGDGAMGFVGPDYGGPYPDPSRKYAVRYRDERTKRPLNIRNIRTTTGSAVHGNFVENYEVLHTFGRKENSKGFIKSGGTALSGFFDGLPATTQEASLVGVVASSAPTKATGVIRITTNSGLEGQTVTIGDGVSPAITYTFRSTPSAANDIQIGANPTTTADNLEARIIVDFNISVTSQSGGRLTVINNNAGTIGNFEFSETMTGMGNTVSGFEGATGVNGSGLGNVALNFNGSNRIPTAIRDQQAADASTFGNTVVATRFSAPGGFETMSEVFLDVASKEYSAYNALPFRNLSVRGSGSGEAGTIRVDSAAGRREGLRTLLARHTGRFGIDSQHGAVSSTDYVAEASFEKINRNTRVIVETGSLIITDSFDNFNVSRPIPSQDYGYSWVTASLGEELSVRTQGQQLAFGYWPKDGILSASANVSWRRNGFDSAVNFPTGSNILGS